MLPGSLINNTNNANSSTLLTAIQEEISREEDNKQNILVHSLSSENKLFYSDGGHRGSNSGSSAGGSFTTNSHVATPARGSFTTDSHVNINSVPAQPKGILDNSSDEGGNQVEKRDDHTMYYNNHEEAHAAHSSLANIESSEAEAEDEGNHENDDHDDHHPESSEYEEEDSHKDNLLAQAIAKQQQEERAGTQINQATESVQSSEQGEGNEEDMKEYIHPDNSTWKRVKRKGLFEKLKKEVRRQEELEHLKTQANSRIVHAEKRRNRRNFVVRGIEEDYGDMGVEASCQEDFEAYNEMLRSTRGDKEVRLSEVKSKYRADGAADSVGVEGARDGDRSSKAKDGDTLKQGGMNGVGDIGT